MTGAIFMKLGRASTTWRIFICPLSISPSIALLAVPRYGRSRSGPLLACRKLHVSLHHEAHELLERSLRLPAKSLGSLRRITEKVIHLGRTVVTRIDFHKIAV